MFVFRAIYSLATLRDRAKEISHTIKLKHIFDAPLLDVFLFLTDRREIGPWLGSASIEVIGIHHLHNDALLQLRDAAATPRMKYPVSLIFRADKADDADSKFTGECIRIELHSQGKSTTAVKLINSWNGDGLSRRALKQERMAWAQWLSHMEATLLSPARHHYFHHAEPTRATFTDINEAEPDTSLRQKPA